MDEIDNNSFDVSLEVDMSSQFETAPTSAFSTPLSTRAAPFHASNTPLTASGSTFSAIENYSSGVSTPIAGISTPPIASISHVDVSRAQHQNSSYAASSITPTLVSTTPTSRASTPTSLQQTPLASAIHRKQPIGANNSTHVSPQSNEVPSNEPQRLYKVYIYYNFDN